MKITNEQLYDWFRISMEEFGLPKGTFPEIRGKKIPGKDVAGLKEAINDTLSVIDHGVEVPSSLELRLAEAGLPSVEEMRSNLRRKEKSILKRGTIRNDEEYYIVREVLSDADSNLRPKTLEKLGRLLNEYESKKKET